MTTSLMLIIVFSIVVYLISVGFMYNFTQKSHYHPHGVFNDIEPEAGDLVLTFMPLVNTIACAILCGLIGWKDNKYKNKTSIAVRFFKPKKK